MGALTQSERLMIGGTLLAAALAGGLHYATEPGLAAFAAATVALAGLAWAVSFATEQVGERFGPGATGVMQSTLGNLPEFFIVMFALADGQVVVAQTSIIGSIFANALLVLGLVILAGARQADDGVMRFRQRLPTDTATLLLLAVFIIVLVGLSSSSSDDASRHIKTISAIGAVLILGVYVLWLVPYVRRDAQSAAATDSGERLRREVPLPLSVGMLALAGTGAAFVSDWFIAALKPSIEQLSLSPAFAGIVIVAIAGNAVENTAGIVLASKGQSDLAISVVKNSVAQIAAFLFPALILVSLLFATPLTFSLAPIYIGALALTALAVWQITGDGEALAFEGWALIAFYLILATFAYFE